MGCWGLSSVFVVTAVQINRRRRSQGLSVAFLASFPPPRSLFLQSSDQRSLTRVVRRGGNRGVGGAFLFRLLGNTGPLCPRHPHFAAPANQPSMLMWLWRVKTEVLKINTRGNILKRKNNHCIITMIIKTSHTHLHKGTHSD